MCTCAKIDVPMGDDVERARKIKRYSVHVPQLGLNVKFYVIILKLTNDPVLCVILELYMIILLTG